MKKKQVATAMAVRSIDTEGPIIRDCHLISQIIYASMRDVQKNDWDITRNTYTGLRFQNKLSRIPDAKPYVERYGDLSILVDLGEANSSGTFSLVTKTLTLHYKRGSVTENTANLKAVLTTSGTLVHELRHWIDSVVTPENAKTMRSPVNGETGYAAYYNQEHEIDARCADLFVRVDLGLLGGAVRVLQGKVDSFTKVYHEALASTDKFFDFVLRTDVAFARTGQAHQALARHLITDEMWEEVKGKVGEFYKLMFDEYGMAFRNTDKGSVTGKRMAAWKSLKLVAAGIKTVDQHLAGVREEKLTPKLVKILGPTASVPERKKARARNTVELQKAKTKTVKVSGAKPKPKKTEHAAAAPIKHSVKAKKTAADVVTKPATKKAPKPAPLTDKKSVPTKKPILKGAKTKPAARKR